MSKETIRQIVFSTIHKYKDEYDRGIKDSKSGDEHCDFDGIKLPKYNDKKSRIYFSPNINPAKAHKNGFNLAIRETEKRLAELKGEL